jgi:hypothetical protein
MIVTVFCQFSSAEYLDLNGNTLLGIIPTELGHLGHTLCKYYVLTAMSILSAQGQHPYIPLHPVQLHLQNNALTGSKHSK